MAEERDPDLQRFMNELDAAARAVQEENRSDIVQFNHAITSDTVDNLLEKVLGRASKRKNLTILLTTYGGNPHAAYRMARVLRKAYERLIVCVFGQCKSAGTLFLFGAHEIVISDWGELGPLDVQVQKDDSLLFPSSGLDIEEAISSIGKECQNLFEVFLTQIILYSSGAITTKTASEIASSMAVGLLSPITQQIDPLKLGETVRQLRIVQDYAYRLLGPELGDEEKKAIAKLSSAYPSHAFAIDREEAAELLGAIGDRGLRTGRVRAPTEAESRLEGMLHHSVAWPREGKNAIIGYLDIGDQDLFSSPQPEVQDHVERPDDVGEKESKAATTSDDDQPENHSGSHGRAEEGTLLKDHEGFHTN